MKTRIVIIALSVMLTAVSCGRKEESTIGIIAHRGYWAQEGASKNSVAALRNAMDFDAWGSEFDVLVTADGIPVVHHDDNTTNGILIEDTTYTELMENAPALSNGEKIPTLEEYMAEWNHHSTKLVLEIKSASTPEKETFFVERILAEVGKHGIKYPDIEYIAFSWHVCNEVLRMDPGATVSYLEGDKSPAEVSAAGMDGIDYNYMVYRSRPEWVKEAHELGLTVNVWTVNKPEVMKEMIALGVDYITTDDPAALREILGTREKKEPGF